MNSSAPLFEDVSNPILIEEWYTKEANAYSGLNVCNNRPCSYEYDALNVVHGLRSLVPGIPGLKVLCFGSSTGGEVVPILSRISSLTLVDSGDFCVDPRISSSLQHVCLLTPSMAGKLPFSDQTFDLVLCLGVLHHIPNVSFQFSELTRVLSCGGVLFMREPITFMGYSGSLRKGLTLMERSIPLAFLDDLVSEYSFSVISRSFCMVPAVSCLSRVFRVQLHKSFVISFLDKIISRPCSLLYSFRRLSLPSRLFSPTSIFFTLKRP